MMAFRLPSTRDCLLSEVLMATINSYGTVMMRREFCPSCHGETFVFEGKLDCCGRDADLSQDAIFIRISEPERKRKLPPVSWRKMILEKQGNRCCYCEQEFGRTVYYKRRAHLLRCCWDHREAYAYSFNNRPENFAAACQLCNAWKSSKLFDSDEEIKSYVKERWRKYGDVRISNLLNKEAPPRSTAGNVQVKKYSPPSVDEGLSDYIIRKRREKARGPLKRGHVSEKVLAPEQLSNNSGEGSLRELVRGPHISAWRQRYEASLRREAVRKNRKR